MVFTMGINFLLVPFVITKLGIQAYGMYALFLFFSLSGGMALLDLGLQGTVVRYLAEVFPKGDRQKITSMILESLILFTGLGLIFSFLLFIFGILFGKHLFDVPSNYIGFLPTFFCCASLSLLIDFIYIEIVTIVK